MNPSRNIPMWNSYTLLISYVASIQPKGYKEGQNEGWIII